ncbi:hypothetical protein N5B55_15205 [Ralstonia pickettii]|uniref:hypothetical protein n=1 Tax=Ralstonia pickettii TaxID=329 RepID=UPI002715532C|nr:hypothetical protein [Ralstonia pickettii]WKZ85078.1 hypothetical protein N5B55_15205 [Ralstonia pickettii]
MQIHNGSIKWRLNYDADFNGHKSVARVWQQFQDCILKGLAMYKCIYTGNEFSEADGEHILQNFLGARWTSSEISSNEAQSKFGSGIDAALEQGLREIRNLLGTKGGRGGDGPTLKNVSSSSGTRYALPPGGVPMIAEPVIKTRPLTDGKHEVQVIMGDMRQVGWAVAKLKQSFPGAEFDIDELKQQAVQESSYIDDRLNLKSGLGGDEFFRGALKSAFNLLGARNVEVALLPMFDALRKFVLNGIGRCPDFVRWLTTPEEVVLPHLGEFDHFLAVYSKDGCVDGYIQFFGEIGYLIRLGCGYVGPDFRYGYLVDPFRESEPAETRLPEFEVKNIPLFESGNELPTESVWPVYGTRFSRILERYYRRADEMNLSKIVDDVLLPYDGQVIRREMTDELSRRAAEYIVHRLFSGQ